MTPKGKAIDLFISYFQRLPNYVYTDLGANKEAKELALIAVNEIIRTLNEDIRDLDVRGSVLLDLIEYWQEVKKEIKKL